MDIRAYIAIESADHEKLAEAVQSLAETYRDQEYMANTKLWRDRNNSNKFVVEFSGLVDGELMLYLVNLMQFPFNGAKFNKVRGYRDNRRGRLMYLAPDDDREPDVCLTVDTAGKTIKHSFSDGVSELGSEYKFEEDVIDPDNFFLYHEVILPPLPEKSWWRKLFGL